MPYASQRDIKLPSSPTRLTHKFAKMENKRFLADFRDEQCIREIQETVGSNGKILVLVSGGVDSSVLAALCFKAVGADRVKCLHIDNGFMRKGWSESFLSELSSCIFRRI